MRVKIITGRVFADGNTQQFGDEVEVSDAEAQKLLAAGQALAVDAPAKPPAGKPKGKP